MFQQNRWGVFSHLSDFFSIDTLFGVIGAREVIFFGKVGICVSPGVGFSPDLARCREHFGLKLNGPVAVSFGAC